jgi:hypothetical protein
MATQQELDELMAARRKILLGERVVSVSSGSGKTVTFDKVSLPALEAEIVRVRLALGQASGVSGPLYPIFGGG